MGPLSIGTLPPLAANGLTVSVDATRARETNRASSRLRLLEGGTGIVRTGKALPVLFEPYWGTTTFVSVAPVSRPKLECSKAIRCTSSSDRSPAA